MSSLFVVPDDTVVPVDWGEIDTAIVLWLNDLLALSNRIIWENQKVAQPDYPYVTLLRSSETDEGSVDETRNRSLDVNGDVVPPGSATVVVTNQEIAYMPITWTTTIQAYSNPLGGGNDPDCNPMKLLSKVKRSLGLTSIVTQLFTAGISIVDRLPVLDTSIVVNGEWINRATLDVIMRTTSVMAEEVGFFDKTQLVSVPFGVDVTVDAS